MEKGTDHPRAPSDRVGGAVRSSDDDDDETAAAGRLWLLDLVRSGRGHYTSRMPRSPRPPQWTTLPGRELLDWRICDLGLTLAGSPVEARVEQLHHELRRRGVRLLPYTWLSSDWFTPDGATGFAIPFYLVHPRLIRLERGRMLDVEGGSHDECMKILRHEAAHAIDNAYNLRRRRRWREVFGSPSEPYNTSYSPDPTSRDHVLNLNYWYSQSHPLEDWAETFAVWVRPSSRWRRRYEGWPALKKLEYVDELMSSLAKTAPKRRTRQREEPVSSVSLTLREYYQRKQAIYAEEGDPAIDGQLARVFPKGADAARRPRAAAFLRKYRRELVRRVAAATGQHSYLLDHVAREMVARCKLLDLRLVTTPAEAQVDAAVIITSLSTQFLYGGHPRYQR